MGGEARELIMRFLKLFIAVIVAPGSFFYASLPACAVDVSSDYRLIPEQGGTPTSISDIAVANSAATLETSAFFDAAEAGAISVEEPTQAALRLTPAVTGGTPLASTVTLPPNATPVPEPGAMGLALAMTAALMRRRRQ